MCGDDAARTEDEAAEGSHWLPFDERGNLLWVFRERNRLAGYRLGRGEA